MMLKFDISIDFDGVIHSYKSGWKGVAIIPDAPNPGAIDWLNMLTDEGVKWCIFSARNLEQEGPPAILNWLEQNGCNISNLNLRDHFPSQKPDAKLMLDDRGLRFDGDFSVLTPKYIRTLKVWYKK